MLRKSFSLLVVLLIVGCVFAYRGNQQTPPSSSRTVLAQQVFDRYVNALGGREAYAKITSRSIKGNFEYKGSQQPTPGSFESVHGVGTIEMYWKAPNKVAGLLFGRPLGGIKRGYNGKDAWGFHPQAGVRNISPSEITEIIRDGMLYQPIALSGNYIQLSYDGKRRLDGPEVDIVEAATKDKRIERFYFDSETGLPVRLDLWEEGPEAVRTPGESYLAQYYLGDYRTVDGVKVPFSIRRVRPHSTMIFTFTEVKQNIALDDSIFEAPLQSPK